MITTKTCSICEHFPNDHHCVGCVWDENKRENTKWELKKNPIVIERKVLEQIRQEIPDFKEKCNTSDYLGCGILELIDKYR